MFRFSETLFRVFFWVLIVVTLSGRLAISFADHRSLIANDIYQDDAFYYLKIADNIARGRGMTFDGTTPTNGFQPLYILLLVPVMWCWQGDLITPIHISGVILSVFAVGTGFLLFALVRCLAGVKTALIGLGLWAVCPYFIVYTVNGLETSLALFFLCAVLLSYVRWFKSAGTGSLVSVVKFGLVCGLAVLARIDLLLLLMAVGLDWSIDMIRRKSLSLELPRAITVAVFALVVWIPWGLVSWSSTGSFLPRSGAAGREIALSYGWFNLQPIWAPVDSDTRFFPADDVPASFYADVGTKQIFVFLFEHPLLIPLRANVPITIWPQLGHFKLYRWFVGSPSTGIVVMSGMLAAVVALLSWRAVKRNRPARQSIPDIGVLVFVFLALSWLGYTFHAPIHWYYSRYLTVPILLTVIYILTIGYAALAPICDKYPIGHKIVILIMATIFACQLNNYRFSHDKPKMLTSLKWGDAEPGGFLENWLKVESKLDKSKPIGAFQAGIYSYFSGLDIVNLDGKVNPAAFKALRDRQLDHYIYERRVMYIRRHRGSCRAFGKMF